MTIPQGIWQDYLMCLRSHHNSIRTALDGLSVEALDWTPGPDMNSITVLVTHLTGAERYWIGDVVFGEPSQRDRDAEFQVRGVPASDLIVRLDQADTYIQDHLSQFSQIELDQNCTSPRDGHQVSAFWALAHALEHTALHTGHIQIQRQIWDQSGE